MVFNVTGEERVHITSSGDVSIGNSSVAFPSGGGLQVYNASAPRIKLTNSTTGVASGDGFQIYVSGSSAILDQKENAEMRFYTEATEKLRITSAGDLQRPKSLSQEVSTSVSSVSATSCGSFAKATYRSAYVIAQITQGSSYQVGRYLVIHDGTTATTIEESAIATGDMLGTFSGVVSGSNVEFRVTMSSASSATVITKIESIVV